MLYHIVWPIIYISTDIFLKEETFKEKKIKQQQQLETDYNMATPKSPRRSSRRKSGVLLPSGRLHHLAL